MTNQLGEHEIAFVVQNLLNESTYASKECIANQSAPTLIISNEAFSKYEIFSMKHFNGSRNWSFAVRRNTLFKIWCAVQPHHGLTNKTSHFVVK